MTIKPRTIQEIADHLGESTIDGNSLTLVKGVGGLRDSGPDDLSFLSNPRYKKDLATTRAGAVIVDQTVERPPGSSGSVTALLRVASPYLAFARALTFLVEAEPVAHGVHPGALVDPSAHVGDGATVFSGACVGAGASIGARTVIHQGAVVMARCKVGSDCILYPGVVLREDCVVGDRVILHANATIGSDGYGFAQDMHAPTGKLHVKIPQVGNVVIEDDVEIGSGTCIDRGAVGQTLIGRGTKIDDLVMIGHGARIGADCLIVAHCSIAGSANLEERVVLGGQVAVAGHITVGAGTMVLSCSQVTKATPPGSVVSGTPTRPHQEQLKQEALLKRLGKLSARVSELECSENRSGKKES